MDPRFLITILFGLLSGLGHADLDKNDILRLADREHSRKDLLPQLLLFPDAREYKTEYTATRAKGKPQTKKDVVVRQKTVGGKYIILESKPVEAKGKLTTVVTFDEESDVYRKWVLTPDGAIAESVGTTARNSRAIGWLQVNTGMQTFTHEQFTDKGVTWTERISVHGDLMVMINGSSTKTK